MSTSETQFPNDDLLNPFPNGIVPEPIRFLNAFEMYKDEIIPTKKDAAVVAEMKVSTFKHRTCGRRSAAEYGKTRRLLLDEEEEVLIWRCEILQRGGFPQSIRDVTAIAEEILRKRELTATLAHGGCNEVYISAGQMWEFVGASNSIASELDTQTTTMHWNCFDKM